MEEEKEHLKVLSMHKHIYDHFLKTGEIVNLYPHIREEIVAAYRVEYPHYRYNGGCYSCVVEMLKTIYRWYETTH
jgi:hypothetical protein